MKSVRMSKYRLNLLMKKIKILKIVLFLLFFLFINQTIMCSETDKSSYYQEWRNQINYENNEIPAIERISLCGIWKFKADPESIGENNEWFSKSIDESGWKDFSVPGVWNEGQDVGVEWNYNGLGWFRKEFVVPKDWKGKRIQVKFLAVYLISDVWLNGVHIGTHKGGYSAFSYDITNQLNFTEENLIVVRADNTPRPGQAPHNSIDWWNCGGISREVYLEKLSDISLDQLHITPGFEQDSWYISIKTKFRQISNTETSSFLPIELRAVIFDQEMRLIIQEERKIQSSQIDFDIEIPDAKPWFPDSPNLYFLKLCWRPVKALTNKWWTEYERFGLRKIETRGTELFLNGRKIWLQGMAMHHDYPDMGSAVTLEAQRSDLEIIKNLNCNFVRLGHYASHPYSADVCDELGLLMWQEIPVWQNAPNELADEGFWKNWVKPQIDEMIEQLYNHPSIIFWSVGNEFSRAWLPNIESPEVIGYVKKSTDYIRSLDKSRLVTYASAAHTGAGTWKFLDVIGKPTHYGWFHSQSVYDIRPRMKQVHEYLPDRPILSVECAGMSYTYPHEKSHAGYSQDIRHSLEYHDKLLRVDIQSLMILKDFVCGVTVWTLADLKGGREVGTYGLLDRERKPKYLYETVRNLFSRDPKLLIIEERTLFQAGEKFNAELWSFTMKKESIPDCKIQWRLFGPEGLVTEGKIHEVNIKSDSAEKIGQIEWQIPDNLSGLHSLVCKLYDSKNNLLFINDFHFDIGTPEKPGIAWIKMIDENGNPFEGIKVEIRDFSKITDSFGMVPFVLNAGKYFVKIQGFGQEKEIEIEVESGKNFYIEVSHF